MPEPDLQPAVSSLQPAGVASQETIAFRPRQRRTPARVGRRRCQLAERRPATVARRLALAHRIAADIEAGRYKDYADVARRHGLTRAVP